MFVYTARRIFILFVEVSQHSTFDPFKPVWYLIWSSANIPNSKKKIVFILGNVPNLSHFQLNSTHVFLIAYLFQSVIVSWLSKSGKIVKRNVKISQAKRQTNQTQNRKNIIFDSVPMLPKRKLLWVIFL